jgi:hypothetical protein
MIHTFFLQCQHIAATNSNWLLDKLLPSLIGAGTALFVFYLTTKRDKKKEQKKKEDDRSDKVIYLKSLLDNIINVTKQQRDNLVEHIEKVRQNSVDFQLMTFVPLTDFTRAIETLSKEDYYSAFNKIYKEKINSSKTYNSIISNVDYLHAQFVEVPEILRKSQQFDFERKLQYKELVDKTINMTGNILFQLRQNMPPVFQAMDNILLEFMEGLNNHADITYYNNEFVIKMNDFLVNYMLTPGIQVPNEILILAENTRNAKQLYSIIIKSNLEVADDIENINKLVNNSLDETIQLRESLP